MIIGSINESCLCFNLNRVLNENKSIAIRATFSSLILLSFVICLVGCGPTEEQKIEMAIEETLDKFYESMAAYDLDSLEGILTEEAKPVAEYAGKSAQFESYYRAYRRVEWEADDFDVDEDKAEVRIKLSRNKSIIEQLVMLERQNDEWRVANYKFICPTSHTGIKLEAKMHSDEAIEKAMEELMSESQMILLDAGIELTGGDINIAWDTSGPVKKLSDSPQPASLVLKPADRYEEAFETVKKKLPTGFAIDKASDEKIELTMLPRTIDAIRRTAIEQTLMSVEQRLLETDLVFFSIARIDEDVVNPGFLVTIAPIEYPRFYHQLLSIKGQVGIHMISHDADGRPFQSHAKEEVMKMLGGKTPLGNKFVPEFESLNDVGQGQGQAILWHLIQKESFIDNNRIETAQIGRSENDLPQLRMTFSNDGARAMKFVSEKNINKQLAIVADDTCVSSAVIMMTMEKEVRVDGFPEELGKIYAIILRTTALPVSVEIERELKIPDDWQW